MVIKCKIENRSIRKSLGLMFAKKPYSLFFKTRFGIHTFFVKFPIDIVILDSKMVVKYFKKSIKPWRIYLWNPVYDGVLELPKGEITKLGIRKGLTLKLVDHKIVK